MIDFAAVTDKGKSRKNNEDYFLAHKDIFAVADGMGGHRAGDVASKLAVQTVNKYYRMVKEKADKGKVIESFFKESNRVVNERAVRISSEQGMGTTMTLIMVDDGFVHIGHIGDSRAYLFRDNKLKQLTDDHSLVAGMVQEGQITEEEARQHPYRNVITKALGSDEEVKPDIFSLRFNNGDRFLLCSDGLTTMIDDETIAEILNKGDAPRITCNHLVKKANANGGNDNITAIVIDFKEGTKKPLLPKIAAAFLIASLVAASATFSTNKIIGKYYYVGYSNDKVAVYRGLPYEAGSWKLSKPVYVSDIKKKELNYYWRERVTDNLSVKNLTEGKESINQIKEEIDSEKP